MWKRDEAGSPKRQSPAPSRSPQSRSPRALVQEESKLNFQMAPGQHPTSSQAQSRLDFGNFDSCLEHVKNAVDQQQEAIERFKQMSQQEDMVQSQYDNQRKRKKKKKRRLLGNEGSPTSQFDHQSYINDQQRRDEMFGVSRNEDSSLKSKSNSYSNSRQRSKVVTPEGPSNVKQVGVFKRSSEVPVMQPRLHENYQGAPPQVRTSQQMQTRAEGSSSNQMSNEDSSSATEASESEEEDQGKDLLELDEVELMSENDSQGSDKKPIGWLQNLYDIWKFLGVINYHVTLCLMIAYYINSNFASQDLLDIFWMFLCVRPGLILVYSCYVSCMDTHKTCVSRRKFVRQKKLDEQNFEQASYIKQKTRILQTDGSLDDDKMEAKQQAKQMEQKQNENHVENNHGEEDLDQIMPKEQDMQIPEQINHIYEESEDEDHKKSKTKKKSKNFLKEIQFENPELATYQELFWQFFFMPVIIFAGLGRLVVLSERKTTVHNFSIAQELFLHTLPLGYLVFYNNDLVQKPRDIDDWIRYSIYGSLAQMLVEVFVLKISTSFKQNLERRPGLKSTTRCDDLLRVFIVACIITTASVLFGLYLFSNQGCIEGSFVENGFCKQCSEYVDINCETCDDRFACKQCKEGYFGLDRQCISCQSRFGRECQTCTAGGCSICSEGFFVSYGQCEECRLIENCKDFQCSDVGCYECEEGYYLDEGQCKSCTQAIAGCTKCDSADQCTECVSEYLFIEKGICKCREEGKNQYTDELTGACFCDDGFYMTDRGCLDCQYLIPGCESCAITSRNTGIPLYNLASYYVNPEQLYLQCELCEDGLYLETTSRFGVSSRCVSCQSRYEACSYCTENGSECLQCYPTHLLEGIDDTPCLRCETWMFGCLKCINKETCTLRLSDRMLLGDYDYSELSYNDYDFAELPYYEDQFGGYH